MEMQDRSVIVTGGASGIGRATALLLAREGARVFIGDVDEARGLAVAQEAAGAGLAIDYLSLDLTLPDTIADFATAVHDRVERVDGLVNGAGWDRIQPFLENPPEMWDQLIAINLLGAVRLTRAVLPPMVAAQAGKIVNISSDAGRVGSMGETVYAAAKGGLIAFTKALGKELAQSGVLVNCVTPAAAQTAILEQVTPEFAKYMLSKIPMGRFVKVEEIAALVCWLASAECSFSTGAVFDISGGRATY